MSGKNKHISDLPPALKPLFWDYTFEHLSWEADRDLIIGRVLADGDWSAVSWLRSRLTDESLRQWILGRNGSGLSPRQLRFWELILELPPHKVNAWLHAEGRAIWEKRSRR